MDLRPLLARATTSLLDLLAPHRCTGCSAPLTRVAALFCEHCAPNDAAEIIELSLDGVPVIASGHYASPLGLALRQFKYADRPDLAKPLARRLWVASRETFLAEPVALVPVPLHPKRLAERGYNQSALIARELGRFSGGCFVPRALQRLHDTPKQAELGRQERQQNLKGAIAARASVALPVVLVDDVFTTGATIRECMGALSASGSEVRGVCVVAVAREEDDAIVVGGDLAQAFT
jgi:ComF family protein